jgi:gas vesicle protein
MLSYKYKPFPYREKGTHEKVGKEMKDMKKKNKSGFLAFLLGGMIGATIGLLYAPQSGEETRKILIDEGQEIVDKAKISMQEAEDSALSTIQETQARIETLNQEAKERIEKLQEIAKNTLHEQKDSLVKGYSNAKEVVME